MNYFRCGIALPKTHTATKIDVAKTPLATFESNVSGLYIPEILAYIQATQEGSGDPYPAGGGKNKCNATVRAQVLDAGITSQVYEDNRIVASGTSTGNGDIGVNLSSDLVLSSGTTYTLSLTGTNTRTASLNVYFRVKGGNYTSPKRMAVNQNSISFSDLDGTFDRILLRTSNTQSITLDAKLMVEQGSSATSYAPYSNIRPISGVSSVDTTVCGVNLFDGKFYAGGSYNSNVGKDYSEIAEEAVTTITEGSYSINVSAWGGIGFLSRDFGSQTGTVVHISGSTTAPSPRMSLYTLDKNKVVMRKTTYGTNRTTFDYNVTLADGEVYVFLWVATADAGTVTVTNIQCEFGSATTSYELPTGTTATTALGGTYYGGYLNVTTGLLTVTKALFDLGSVNYTYNSTHGFFYTNMPAASADNIIGGRDGMSDIYKLYQGNLAGFKLTDNTFTYNNSSIGGAKTIGIRDTYTTDPDVFKTRVIGHYVIYELATPQTVQLTPAEITQLFGQNNVFCSSGDVAVKYWKID